MKPFHELTNRGRGRRLRALALAALPHYDLDVRRLRLLTNEQNAIFRLDTAAGQKYILRIGLPAGAHSLEEVRSEMMWLDALGRETDLGIPRPLPTGSGELALSVAATGVPEPRNCAIFSWLPGPDLADRRTAANMAGLGQFMARLHAHARRFQPPPGFHVRTLNRVFPWSDPTFPTVEPVVLFDAGYRDFLPPARREIFRRAVAALQPIHDDLCRGPDRPIVIHNDLHLWNVKVYRGRIFAFDFEDLMWGYPVQDIATTLYYIQDLPHYRELRLAFTRGYQGECPWPEAFPGQIEAFMAGRGLMLANYMLLLDDPEAVAFAPELLRRVERRLRRYLER